ncbi:circularly permuted type 2 ATP-grasp protein [Peptococcaceae bacterium 1198_IL3148]
MGFNTLLKEYVALVTNHPDRYYQDYLATINAVENSSAKFNNQTVPFLYNPLFFSTEDIKSFQGLTNTLMGILQKVIEKFISSPSFRIKFGFDQLLEELILVDPGYEVNIPMSRFDIFYYRPGVFKFCELNADGSSGMHKTNELERIFLNTAVVNQLKTKYQLSYYELIDTWVNESLKNYQQFNGHLDRPNVVIMDWQQAGNLKEFEAFKQAYENKGCRAAIADPRHLRYDGQKLYYRDMRVDLIYRRLVTSELISNHQQLTDFIQAYRAGAVCVIGPLRSEIIHNKIIFKILHHDTEDLLSAAEREFINKHVPYTAEFSGEESLFLKIQHNKDNFVLKPKDQYAAAGVYVGKDYSNTQWQRLTAQCWENNYLVQEYCQPFVGPLIEFKQQQAVVNNYNQMLGLFVYNQKFAGLYTRVGRNNVISQQHGYYLLPNFVIGQNL